LGDYTDGYAGNDDSLITTCEKEVTFDNCLKCLRENYRRGITCTKLVGTKGFRRIIYSREWIETIKEKEKKQNE